MSFTLTNALLAMAIFSVSAICNAQQFSPPQEIQHSGKAYKLAFKNEQRNGRAIYEYTADAEPISKWTTLVTLNYSKGLRGAALDWLAAMKRTLDAAKPVPHYSLYLNSGSGYARIIFEPDAKNPVYESNVHKHFNISECGGTLVYQFAAKYPPATDQSEAGKRTALEAILAENKSFAESLEKSEWAPLCQSQ